MDVSEGTLDSVREDDTSLCGDFSVDKRLNNEVGSRRERERVAIRLVPQFLSHVHSTLFCASVLIVFSCSALASMLAISLYIFFTGSFRESEA